MTFDFLIIGGGIIGITVAREIASHTKGTVAIVEKEPDIARHASGRNSGVLHAGFYYSADSLKAKLCRQGNMEMRAYCKKKALKLNECGKVIVTKNEAEIEMLDELEKRGKVNGVELEPVDEKKLQDIEPHAITCKKALYSPHTSMVEPQEICHALMNDAANKNVKLLVNTEVTGLLNHNTVSTNRGNLSFAYLINCAGAFADKIAHAFSTGTEYTMLPFKGTYFELNKHKASLIRLNIYPVPDLRFPFLGVHVTKTVQGNVLIGPTATPVFSRENYQGWNDLNIKEAPSILITELKLFIQNKEKFRALAAGETKMLLKSNIVREVKRMVSGISASDAIKSTHSGIRAQLFNMKLGKLEMDFVIRHTENSTHILNAVSPAFTCSLPFARYVVDEMRKRKIL